MSALILTEPERSVMVAQTIWLCGGLTVAMAALIFFAWWFWYPEVSDL
ncbi:hypothetical protein [Shinella zoogloeoides]|nr:hypothetical protein [Shinella zoogloeoides]